MAGHVLAFPHPEHARRSLLHAATPALPLDAEIPEADLHRGLQLVPDRPRASSKMPDTLTQAQHIAAQVERELAGRVQREATERHREIRHEFRMPSRTDRRAFASSMPPQATENGLRHRLLDALLFFARPA